MSLSKTVADKHWQQCTRDFVAPLPVLHFPFETPTDIYAPASTVLRFDDGSAVYAFIWCYLDREVSGNKSRFNPSSLSEARVQAMPRVLERLSKWFRFSNARPRTIKGTLLYLGQLINWADAPHHAGRFEALLSNPDLALDALRGYHTYLRNQCQNHRLTALTAGVRDQRAISCLSEIHGRVYKDHIEPLQAIKGKGTEAPESEAVQKFASTLQAIFDSSSALILGGGTDAGTEGRGHPRLLQVGSSNNDSGIFELKEGYGRLRLMELACVTFAGLAFVDTGANFAVLQSYEEPDDLEGQLAEPDRINLTQKAVKFRARGKQVEVHLSAITVTRLRTYLRIRQKLVASLGGSDIAPMFVMCSYGERSKAGAPTVRPLHNNFLQFLRQKVTAVGASLPNVTLRQLRAYKQQDLVRRAPVAVAAQLMGHSVKTAVQAYCKSQEATRRGELSQFLGSLQNTVREASGLEERSSQNVIPIGSCTDHGKPASIGREVVVQPDCKKVQGCFFCDNYRVHADGEDMRKLMSCRRVLKQIAPLKSDSLRAERIYTAVVDRIDVLLSELKRRQPRVFEAARVDVDERGQLSRYWSSKLAQLHLLGMLPPSMASQSPITS